jgi:hypothetical protein
MTYRVRIKSPYKLSKLLIKAIYRKYVSIKLNPGWRNPTIEIYSQEDLNDLLNIVYGKRWSL